MGMGRIIGFGEARDGAKKGSDGKYIGVGMGWCGFGGRMEKRAKIGIGLSLVSTGSV